jgi:hypothetical protein
VLPVEQGTQFVTCEFCQTSNFVDKSGAVLHYLVRDTLGEAEALAALRRWMAGNDTVKDLDKKSQIGTPQFQLFPMWLVRAQQDQAEKVVLEPAAALSVIELTEISIPAADLEAYDHAVDAAAIEPTVPLETVHRWLADNKGIAVGAIRENSLVHLPIFVCKYSFQGREYTAVVDAAAGKVFATVFPSKWEVPYLTLGCISFVAYFLAALIPLGGILSGSGATAVAILIYLIVATIIAVPIFAAAAIISSKV